MKDEGGRRKEEGGRRKEEGVNSQSLLNARRGLLEKTQESEPEECGRIHARRILFGKREGM